jgi:molybdopterin synthase catalytic subunit
MLELCDGALDVEKIYSRWFSSVKDKNFGAIMSFVGVVRDENGIDGLSFDIYEPILNKWFHGWVQKAQTRGAHLLMAHSRGDVLKHKSSYMCGVCSPKRRVSLDTIDEFVEDFKSSAPIWKYDLINGGRIYARGRSTPLIGSGILK